MEQGSSLINKIRGAMSNLSKGQKKLAGYIIDNYENAAFMTASELGEVAKVSESSVVRFAMKLGYSGYPALQKEMANLVKEKITAVGKIEIKDGLQPEAVLDRVFQMDKDNIALMGQMMDRDSFATAVDMISDADTIYIVGIRACAPLATAFGLYLRMIFPRVVVIDSSNTSEVFEQLLHVSEKDVVIGISFPRYSVRTLKAMEFANNRNARVIAITDSKHSPMNMYSSCNLFAPTQLATVVDSYTAPLSLINSLVVAISLKNKDLVVRNNELLEAVCRDYQYNDSDEIDYLDEDLVSDLMRLEGNE